MVPGVASIAFGEGWGDWPADATPMKVEEYLEDGTCVIRAELPGIDPETDVHITVADGVLPAVGGASSLLA